MTDDEKDRTIAALQKRVDELLELLVEEQQLRHEYGDKLAKVLARRNPRACLRIRCPECGADAGKACRTANDGHCSTPHLARRRAASEKPTGRAR